MKGVSSSFNRVEIDGLGKGEGGGGGDEVGTVAKAKKCRDVLNSWHMIHFPS